MVGTDTEMDFDVAILHFFEMGIDTDESLDERDAVPDADEIPEEEEDGEDLFGENLAE